MKQSILAVFMLLFSTVAISQDGPTVDSLVEANKGLTVHNRYFCVDSSQSEGKLHAGYCWVLVYEGNMIAVGVTETAEGSDLIMRAFIEPTEANPSGEMDAADLSDLVAGKIYALNLKSGV